VNHFIKIGSIIINIAHVSSVTISEQRGVVSVACDADGEPHTFNGREALEVYEYFTSIAQDLMQSEDTSR
jgi:hypothetical protein